ncbi:MAG: hypothetical protein EOM52_02140 [Clostridia bacterium]|nr:hypothetical protein [Clostridia bacterium]
MSLDAVQKVTESEQRAMKAKAEAAEQAKRMLSDAENAGRARLESARTEADSRVKELIAGAEERAVASTQTVMEETQRKCDDLRHMAEGRLQDAAALIIGKVVGV